MFVELFARVSLLLSLDAWPTIKARKSSILFTLSKDGICTLGRIELQISFVDRVGRTLELSLLGLNKRDRSPEITKERTPLARGGHTCTLLHPRSICPLLLLTSGLAVGT